MMFIVGDLRYVELDDGLFLRLSQRPTSAEDAAHQDSTIAHERKSANWIAERLGPGGHWIFYGELSSDDPAGSPLDMLESAAGFSTDAKPETLNDLEVTDATWERAPARASLRRREVRKKSTDS